MRLRGIFRQLKRDSCRLMPAGSGKLMFLLLFWRAPGEVLRRRRIVARVEAAAAAPPRLLRRRDQNSRHTPHGRDGATGACTHRGCAAFAFVLKKGFAPDRVDVEGYERDHHRQEKTTQHVRSRLVAYRFTIHRYSSGWKMSGRRSEVDPTMPDAARRLRRATFRKLAALKIVIGVV